MGTTSAAVGPRMNVLEPTAADVLLPNGVLLFTFILCAVLLDTDCIGETGLPELSQTLCTAPCIKSKVNTGSIPDKSLGV